MFKGFWRAQDLKNHAKTYVKQLIMYFQHFCFGYVLGARNNFPKPPRDTPEAPQEASEGAPGAPKGAQGLPRDVSKAPLGAPKAPQKHPLSTPR